MSKNNPFALPAKFTALVILLAGIAHTASTQAETLKQSYLDGRHNVHVVTATGRHLQLTRTRNATDLKLAPDKQTAAWQVMNDWTAAGDDRPQSEKLAVYRNSKISYINCGAFVRGHWFWRNGRQIAVECGGRHFSGYEILYDTSTLKELARLDQGKVPWEQRPDWSTADH